MRWHVSCVGSRPQRGGLRASVTMRWGRAPRRTTTKGSPLMREGGVTSYAGGGFTSYAVSRRVALPAYEGDLAYLLRGVVLSSFLDVLDGDSAVPLLRGQRGYLLGGGIPRGWTTTEGIPGGMSSLVRLRYWANGCWHRPQRIGPAAMIFLCARMRRGGSHWQVSGLPFRSADF